jgi:hypothetical protein
MIRTVLASPWLPLLYWSAALLAMIYVARQHSPKRGHVYRDFQRIVSAPAQTPGPIPGHSSASHPQLAKRATTGVSQPTHMWYPQILALQRRDAPLKRSLSAELANQTPILPPPPQIAVAAPVTMLSIRAEPTEPIESKTLAIQCRTSVAVHGLDATPVTIHGVVTQEVVSSSGKILIMAGSKVVGSGLLDSENGRFKSDGLWSLFFDDTELQVQAQLLDRPAGLLGLLGQEDANEEETLRKGEVRKNKRSIFVPRNAPFVLQIHGEILLRDLPSNEGHNN